MCCLFLENLNMEKIVQVMYDATGVRLQAGRQAEVRCFLPFLLFFCTWQSFTIYFRKMNLKLERELDYAISLGLIFSAF